MEKYEKIIELSSEYEAELMEEILNDNKIPHGIVPFSDSALGGLWEMEHGWGYIEAPELYKEAIQKYYKEVSGKKRM